MQTIPAIPAQAQPAFVARRRTADRIFKAALAFNTSLTVFWLVMLATWNALICWGFGVWR